MRHVTASAPPQRGIITPCLRRTTPEYRSPALPRPDARTARIIRLSGDIEYELQRLENTMSRPHKVAYGLVIAAVALMFVYAELGAEVLLNSSFGTELATNWVEAINF
jgi:hypothetical protein